MNQKSSLRETARNVSRVLTGDSRYPSLSAVLQHGLELLRSERELEEAELAALRALLKTRRAGEFISVAKGRERTQRMIRAKKAG